MKSLGLNCYLVKIVNLFSPKAFQLLESMTLFLLIQLFVYVSMIALVNSFDPGTDARPESVLFSSGISEQCSQHGKILQSLQSASNVSEGEGLNMPLISDRMGFKSLETDFCHQSGTPVADDFHLYEVGGDYLQPSLVYPEAEVLLPKPILDCFEESTCSSTMRILPDSRLLFMGTEAEISNLLSMLSEFYLSKKSTTLSRRQMVVPYFRRYMDL